MHSSVSRKSRHQCRRALLCYRSFDTLGKLSQPAKGEMRSEPVPSYAAIVLRAGEQEPEFVRLGSAQMIEGLVAAWRRNIARQAEVMDTRAGGDAYRRLGAVLRRRIWDPLVP